jgi:dTDP-glucose 4,6-dehydratase
MNFVTGCAGFIGSNFVHTWLSNHNEPIVNLDNLSSLTRNHCHIFVQGDIGDQTLVSDLLSTYKPCAVLNFAAESHVDRSILGTGEFIQTNALGTFNLHECVRAYWSNQPAAGSSGDLNQASFRFLHISTDEVYSTLGPQDPPFNETSPYEPNNPYAASKASSDHLVRDWHHTYGLPILTTNCSDNYGPYHFPKKLIPLVILNALNDKPLPIYGDGQQIRDWLFVQNHCRAIERVLEAGRIDETYNIDGWNEMANIDVVKTICSRLDALRPRADGKKYAEQITYIKDRPGHDRRYAIDGRKIEHKLGWKPAETFETGIEKTVQWYLDNQNGLKA